VILAIPYNISLRLFLGCPTLVGKALSFTHKLVALFLFFVSIHHLHMQYTYKNFYYHLQNGGNGGAVVMLPPHILSPSAITHSQGTVAQKPFAKDFFQVVHLLSPNSTCVKARKLMAGCGLLYITACKLNAGSRSESGKEHCIGMSQGRPSLYLLCVI